MSQGKIKFEDASGYDQMMGFWSQLVGDKFLRGWHLRKDKDGLI